jgi:Na+-transporting methylmalonyl-CoA/oxaloacetate decarboxylase beta subunit
VTIQSKRLGYYLRSLVTTIIITFLLPLILAAIGWLVLAALQQSWGINGLAQDLERQLLDILTTLGNGSPWQGVLTMALTSSVVGVLFDLYALYQNQSPSR